jgi:plasmid maintenance system antidote protein VapI
MNKILKAKIVEKFGHQFTFAQAIGEHEGTVSRIINGKRTLDQDRQKRWAEALGVDTPNKIFEQGCQE